MPGDGLRLRLLESILLLSSRLRGEWDVDIGRALSKDRSVGRPLPGCLRWAMR